MKAVEVLGAIFIASPFIHAIIPGIQSVTVFEFSSVTSCSDLDVAQDGRVLYLEGNELKENGNPTSLQSDVRDFWIIPDISRTEVVVQKTMSIETFDYSSLSSVGLYTSNPEADPKEITANKMGDIYGLYSWTPMQLSYTTRDGNSRVDNPHDLGSRTNGLAMGHSSNNVYLCRDGTIYSQTFTTTSDFSETYIIGTGVSGGVDGGTSTGQTPESCKMTVNSNETALYIATGPDHTIRMTVVESSGSLNKIYTLAGVHGDAGDIVGDGDSARFNNPSGIGLHEISAYEHDLYICDAGNSKIKRLSIKFDGFVSPTASPTDAPSLAPSAAPTNTPTLAPSEAPSVAPTLAPTNSPTLAPTQAPTPPCEANVALVVDFTYSIQPAQHVEEGMGFVNEFITNFTAWGGKMSLTSVRHHRTLQHVSIDDSRSTNQTSWEHILSTLGGGWKHRASYFWSLFTTIADSVVESGRSGHIVLVSDGRLRDAWRWRQHLELKNKMIEKWDPNVPRLVCIMVGRSVPTKFFDAVCDDLIFDGNEGMTLATQAALLTSRICSAPG